MFFLGPHRPHSPHHVLGRCDSSCPQVRKLQGSGRRGQAHAGQDGLVPEARSWHLTVWGPKAASSWVTSCWEGACLALTPTRLGRGGAKLPGWAGHPGGDTAVFPFSMERPPPSYLFSLGSQPSYRQDWGGVPNYRAGRRDLQQTAGSTHPIPGTIPPQCLLQTQAWVWVLVSCP